MIKFDHLAVETFMNVFYSTEVGVVNHALSAIAKGRCHYNVLSTMGQQIHRQYDWIDVHRLGVPHWIFLLLLELAKKTGLVRLYNRCLSQCKVVSLGCGYLPKPAALTLFFGLVTLAYNIRE